MVAGLEAAAADRLEDVENERHRQWVALGDEGAEPAGDAGQLVGIGGGTRHAPLLCTDPGDLVIAR
jgi:hypothetical protein